MTGARSGIRRAGSIVREVLLTSAALGGLICIVLVILAFTGGFSLIMFATGSMAPTIPAGSVALVQSVPASAVAVGDVVTVDRPGTLPLTHRIRSIELGPTEGERILVLRGDANPADDPLPYNVSEVRVVRGAIPNVAPLIVFFGSPWVLGTLTVSTAALVTWAFWPRRPVLAGAEAPGEAPGPPDAIAEPTHRTVAPVKTLTAALIVAGAAATTIGGTHPDAAAAAVVESYLELRSSLDGAGVQRLDPTIPFSWDLEVDASAAPPGGELTLSLASTGDAAFGLRAEARVCEAVWRDDGSCPAGEQTILPQGLVRVDGVGRELLTTITPDVLYVRIALTAAPAPEATDSVGASVTLRASAGGQTVEAGVEGAPDLPETGGRSPVLLLAPAAVSIGVGIALLVRTSRHRGRA